LVICVIVFTVFCIEETSGYVRPEWVNKWPNSMKDIWLWWWCIFYTVFVLFRLCIFILICFVCTSVRTTVTEWQINCSNNNNNNNNFKFITRWAKYQASGPEHSKLLKACLGQKPNFEIGDRQNSFYQILISTNICTVWFCD
jgi:hypothetical protein